MTNPLKITYLRTDELIPYARNSRTHSQEQVAQIAASIREFGFTNPILEFDKPARNGEHPTMKPVALFEYQLLNNTKGGDAVLDSFGGSGTTLIAAEKNGRIARLMELDPKYCDVIVTRWQAFTGKHAHLEADGRSFTEVMGERSPGTLVGNEAGATDRKEAAKKSKKVAA